jgi:hypothetical protein
MLIQQKPQFYRIEIQIENVSMTLTSPTSMKSSTRLCVCTTLPHPRTLCALVIPNFRYVTSVFLYNRWLGRDLIELDVRVRLNIILLLPISVVGL